MALARRLLDPENPQWCQGGNAEPPSQKKILGKRENEGQGREIFQRRQGNESLA